ncbi:hypothetical protein AVEN_34479-1 [Araneus ventricosus]|uniref:Uncharacterized protein n=1 Tax=Araneus ventricosus TaxID=182803 RepID=A0A4Y2S880_ARAVE|nr:hypothetical protein AVEN_34479-1 [Araneus ventricosus]
MVDGVVLSLALLEQRSVRTLAVRKNSCPRHNILFGDFDQRLCRSILNHHKKALLTSSFNPSKQPFYFHSLTFMVFPFPKLAFVDFNDLTYAAELSRFANNHIDADLTAKALPIHNNEDRFNGFFAYRVNGDPFSCTDNFAYRDKS